MLERTRPFGLAGLIGLPVAQSRSPVIHDHWLAEHGIPGRYVPLPVTAEGLPAALAGLAALGFRGCNVTMPHKRAVIPHLARIDPAARRIDAVNTVVVEADGTLSGSNSDGAGFLQSVLDACPGWRAEAGPVLLVGAGGAARSVAVALLAAGVRDLRVVNRSPDKAEAMAAEFGPRVAALPWARRADALADLALLVNTTDRGMAGKPALDLALARLGAGTIAADLIYTPLETPFLAEARARGNPTVNGLGMLLHQARFGFHAWYGVMPAITPGLIRAVEATFRTSPAEAGR